jgi:D-3-phosphoglycerate dehydrogenase
MLQCGTAHSAGAQGAGLAAHGPADATLRPQGGVSTHIVGASSHSRVFARHDVDSDEAELNGAVGRGAIMTNALGINTNAAWEPTLAWLLALGKELVALVAVVAAGCSRGCVRRPGDLTAMWLGLNGNGCGRIGQGVACPASAFRRGVASGGGTISRIALPGIARAAPVQALAATRDAVSQHCPSTPDARGVSDAEALAAIPANDLLLNAACSGSRPLRRQLWSLRSAPALSGISRWTPSERNRCDLITLQSSPTGRCTVPGPRH